MPRGLLVRRETSAEEDFAFLAAVQGDPEEEEDEDDGEIVHVTDEPGSPGSRGVAISSAPSDDDDEDEGVDLSPRSKLLPTRPLPIPPPPHGLGLVDVRQSPLAAVYAARLKSDADYARYKACKDSAESFYSRLAALQTLHSYGYYLNPLTLPHLVYQQQLQAAQQQQQQQQMKDGAGNNNLRVPHVPMPISPILSPPHSCPQEEFQKMLMSPVRKRPSPSSPCSSTQDSPSTPLPSPAAASTPSKKAKMSNQSPGKRKASRKLQYDDFKTSPVSGTIIVERADGEEIPAITKGN